MTASVFSALPAMAVLNHPLPDLSSLHEYPIIATLILVGAFCAAGMILCYFLRVLTEVIEAWYEFRSRCATAKDRFRRLAHPNTP